MWHETALKTTCEGRCGSRRTLVRLWPLAAMRIRTGAATGFPCSLKVDRGQTLLKFWGRNGGLYARNVADLSSP